MARWQVHFQIDRTKRRPVPTQLAEAVIFDIRRGRLKPGDRLPGSRTLATSLQVHRNTILAAYTKLEAEGWLTTTTGSGTFVSRELPEVKLTARAPRRAADQPGFDLPPARTRSQTATVRPSRPLVLDWGVPDVRLFPAPELARAYRRALRATGTTTLRYAAHIVHPRLHAALAAMLADTRGLPMERGSGRLLVTRGSQMAVYLIAQTLLGPGDVAAVENPGYEGAFEACRLAGARVVPLPVDEDGLQVELLARLVHRTRVRAVFVTPHHQYPTTVTLAAGRRLELLRLAAKERMAVVEDDYDNEFHYEGPPVLPLANSDNAGVVIYVGSLSKITAPALRLGYVLAPPAVIARLAALRFMIDIQNDQVLDAAMAELIEEGELQRHVRRARRIYKARRDALAETLRQGLGDVVDFRLPRGGLALWVGVKPGVDVEAWARRARARGLLFHTGRAFTVSGTPLPFFRLGFAANNSSEMHDNVRRLARALPSLRKSTK